MLEPVHQLLFGYHLALSRDQIKIFYKRYKTDNSDDMQAIIDQKLAPGLAFKSNF